MTALLRSALICMMVLGLSAPLGAEPVAGRFFLMGDGVLRIRNAHTGREVKARLLAPDGSLDEDGLTKIDEVFGLPTRERGEHISPRLIFMLDYFSDLVAPGKVIDMESGYRNPDYNSTLRKAGGNVAKTSLHMDGMAIDFSIQGVKGKALWEIIRSEDCCGVGHYGGASVHLDAGKPRFWEASTSKVRTGESDNNRHIYLSTDFDRYKAGERVKLSFCAVSDYGFGVKPTIAVMGGPEEKHTAVAAKFGPQVTAGDGGDCVLIENRQASHFLYATLPADLREGRYRLRIEFCRKPFEQMPQSVLSNEIQIERPAP